MLSKTSQSLLLLAALAGVLPAPGIRQATSAQSGRQTFALYLQSLASMRGLRAELSFDEERLFFGEAASVRGAITARLPGRMRLDLDDEEQTIAVVVDDRVTLWRPGSSQPEEMPLEDWRWGEFIRGLRYVLRPDLATRINAGAARFVARRSGNIVDEYMVDELAPLQGTPEAALWTRVEMRYDSGFRLTSVRLEAPDGDVRSIVLGASVWNPQLGERDLAGPVDVGGQPPTEAPGAPLDAVTVDSRGGEATIFWRAPESGAPPTSYVVEVGWFPGTAHRARIDTGSARTSYALRPVNVGPYYLRVRGRNEVGIGPPSNEIYIEGRDPLPSPVSEEPAYVGDGPSILYDEAHNNFLTADGAAGPLLDFLRSDGYAVSVNRGPLGRETLADHDVLVVVNAYAWPPDAWRERGYDWFQWSPESAVSAFDAAEIDAIAEWVREGGALLLAAGQAPWAGAASQLAAAFGVEMRNVETRRAELAPSAEDSPFGPRVMHFVSVGFLEAYERGGSAADYGLIDGDHPIYAGRNEGERLDQVYTYLGQSMRGPEQSTNLLEVEASVRDWWKDGPGAPWQSLAATGRSQALALKVGAGRVVMLGDAVMLMNRGWRFGRGTHAPLGLAWPEDHSDHLAPEQRPLIVRTNRQFTLSVFRWLSGLLEPAAGSGR